MADTPKPRDYLRFLAMAARESLRLSQADDWNAAVKSIESLIADAEAREAIAADQAKKPE